MAKWRRGGGRRGGRWVIEYVPPAQDEAKPLTPGVTKTPDPYEHDDPYQIRNALAAMENDPPPENSEAVN